MQLPLARDARQGKPLRGRPWRPCPASASRSPDRMEAMWQGGLAIARLWQSPFAKRSDVR